MKALCVCLMFAVSVWARAQSGDVRSAGQGATAGALTDRDRFGYYAQARATYTAWSLLRGLTFARFVSLTIDLGAHALGAPLREDQDLL